MLMRLLGERNAMPKMGYYFNQAACIGCKTCQIACKDKNDLKIGLLFRHVRDFEIGEYPKARIYHHSLTCNHCENPACVAACPNGSMYIDDVDGTVQHDYSTCIGCQYCVSACPYGVPVYNEEIGQAVKCDACIELRANGEQPACVASCPMRALEFGPIEELEEAHPDAVRTTAILPEPTKTSPCTIIDAKEVALDPGYREVFL